MSSKAGLWIDRSKTGHSRLSEIETLRLCITAERNETNITFTAELYTLGPTVVGTILTPPTYLELRISHVRSTPSCPPHTSS